MTRHESVLDRHTKPALVIDWRRPANCFRFFAIWLALGLYFSLTYLAAAAIIGHLEANVIAPLATTLLLVVVLWTVSYLWVNQTVPLRDSGGKRCEKGFDYPLLPVGLVWLLGHIFFCLGILLLAQDTPLALPDSFLGGIATSIAFSGLFLRPALRWVGRVPSREGETA